MNYMKDLKFKVPIYNETIRYIETDNFIEIYDKANVGYSHNDQDCGGINCIIRGENTIMVKTKYANHWGTIAHEALHATNRILHSRGVEIDANNDEAQAYLLTYILDKIQKFKK